MRDELQELVDEVSRLLAAPATLEDADFSLLAFCAHSVDPHSRPDGGMDVVRTRSILTRGSPPETRRWFEEFGIAAAEAPLRTPADPASGILTRLMIPVRHAGRTHGYLWLLDEGRTDPDETGDEALAAALDLAAEAGRLLAGRTAGGTTLDRALRSALAGAAGARQRATRVLGERLGPGSAQVLLALSPAGGVLPADWPLPGAGAVSAVIEGNPDPGGAAAPAAVPAAGPAGPPAGPPPKSTRSSSPSFCRCPTRAICARPPRSLRPPSPACRRAARRGFPPCGRGWPNSTSSGAKPGWQPVSPPPFPATSPWRTGRSWARGGWSASCAVRMPPSSP